MEALAIPGLHRVRKPRPPSLYFIIKPPLYGEDNSDAAPDISCRWGYLQTGSGAPDDILPMISRLVDLEYSSRSCRSAFDIYTAANISNINKYGAFDISYPRLAWLDGEWDPWRAAGVQALSQPRRESTPSEPVILIDNAVHHWDENGVYPNQTTADFPPPAVKKAKEAIREFTLAWLEDWVPRR